MLVVPTSLHPLALPETTAQAIRPERPVRRDQSDIVLLGSKISAADCPELCLTGEQVYRFSCEISKREWAL